MEQDGHMVECYIGGEKIGEQNINNVLVSQKGLEFNLSYLIEE